MEGTGRWMYFDQRVIWRGISREDARLDLKNVFVCVPAFDISIPFAPPLWTESGNGSRTVMGPRTDQG
jgi:hypothetical protein